jgi:hypothetical protein
MAGIISTIGDMRYCIGATKKLSNPRKNTPSKLDFVQIRRQRISRKANVPNPTRHRVARAAVIETKSHWRREYTVAVNVIWSYIVTAMAQKI